MVKGGIELNFGIFFYGSWNKALMKFIFVGIALVTSIIASDDYLSFFALALVFLASNVFDYIDIFIDESKHKLIRRIAIPMFFIGIMFMMLCVLPLVNDSINLGFLTFTRKRNVITIFSVLYVAFPLIDFARQSYNYINATNKYKSPEEVNTAYEAASKMFNS